MPFQPDNQFLLAQQVEVSLQSILHSRIPRTIAPMFTFHIQIPVPLYLVWLDAMQRTDLVVARQFRVPQYHRHVAGVALSTNRLPIIAKIGGIVLTLTAFSKSRLSPGSPITEVPHVGQKPSETKVSRLLKVLMRWKQWRIGARTDGG